MLSVTPVDVEPLKIIGHVVKMFESESAKHAISVTVFVEPSFDDLGLHSARLDPSRLTQVIVNILVRNPPPIEAEMNTTLRIWYRQVSSELFLSYCQEIFNGNVDFDQHSIEALLDLRQC
jgi:hypothetical protein